MSKSITSFYMKAILLMVLMMVMPSFAMADKEMWVGWNGTTHTLTFFYNESKATAEFDAKYDIPTTSETEIPAWHEHSSEIQTVVIDPSFADARPTLTMGWFYGISSITTIKGLEYINTSEVTNMKAMFAFCSKLSSIDVSHFDTSSATDLSGLFAGCTSLTELDLTNFQTSKVLEMDEMFTNATGLTKVNLSSFDMSSIESLSQMFEGCSSLKEIWVNASFSIPDYNNGKSVTSYNMFNGCTQLPHFDATKVDKTLATLYQNGGYLYSAKVEPWVEYADNALTFHYDNQRYLKVENGLKSTIYDYDPTVSLNPSYGWAAQKANVTKVSFDDSFAQVTPATLKGFFKNFSALTTLEGLKNLNAAEATSMSEMFYGCSALPSISLDMTDGEKVAETTRMFYGCSSLKSVTFPSEGVKLSHVTDMRNMFEKCSLLIDVDLTALSAPSLVDMQAMFKDCAALESIDLSNVLTTSVSDMSYLFQGCTSLKTVTLSDVNTEGVSEMSYLFSGCSSLASLDLSSFNTAKVTNMASMFSGCSSLTSLDLSGFNTEAVTNMASMFSGCASMKTFPISGFNTEKVTSMASMFSGCTALKGLQPTNFNTANVTDMSSMFEGCSSLHALDITSFATVTNAGDYSRMFANNANLRYIFSDKIFTLDKTAGTYTDMFLSTPNLPNYVAYEVDATHATPESPKGYFTAPVRTNVAWVEVTDTATMVFHNDADYFARSFGHLLNTGDNTPSWIEAPSWLPAATDVTKVIINDAFSSVLPTSCYQWFKGLSKATEIEGIENLVTDEVTNMQEMFSGCSALQKLDVSAFMTEKATTMKEMFALCSTIKSLDLTGWNTEAVTDMTHMFYNGSALETIYAGYGFVTTNVSDDLSSEMFYGCEHLTNYDASHTDRIKAVFTTQGGCLTMAESTPWVAYDDKQQSLTLHYGLRTVSTSTIHTYELGDYTKAAWRNLVIKQVYIAKDMTEYRPTTLKGLFQGLESLERVNNLSYINYGAVTDMSNMFAQCRKLSYPVYFDNADLTNVKDMSGMFAGCDTLSAVDLSSVATSALTTTASMFAGCTQLKNVDLSSFYTANVTDMSSMFFGCENLEKVNLTSFNTAKVTDMAAMFARCQSIKTIDVSSFNTASVTNMNLMFNNCAALDTIYASSSFVPSESCTGMGMFYGCERLFGYNENKDGTEMAKSIEDGGYLTYGQEKPWVGYNQQECVLTFHYDDLKGKVEGDNFTYDLQLQYDALGDIPWKGMNAKKVVIDSRFAKICPTSMAYWFYGMTNLKTFEGLEHLNTSNVTSMSKMFAGCSSLDSLDLSSFNTANVATMEQMFMNCSSLQKLNLSSFNTYSVQNTDRMFQGCTSIPMLDLRSFDASAIRHAGYMFNECTALQRILVTAGFLPISDEIVDTENMFLGDVKLYNYDPAKVGGTMAKYIVDGGYLDEYNGQKEPWVAYYPEAKTLKFLYNSDRLLTLDSDTYKSYLYTADNEQYANYPWHDASCENTETVVFDDSYAEKENTNLWRFFQDYKNLKTIEGLKNLNTSSVTSMRDMFNNCQSLTSLDLSSFDTHNCQSMNQMFKDCPNLTDLNVSQLDVQSLQDALGMFQACSSLKNLTLNWKNATSLNDMRNMFKGCQSLTDLDLSSLHTENVTLMYRLFEGCSSLKNINLSSFSTDSVTQMDYMFHGCSSLDMLDLSSFSTAKVKSTSGMFEYCDSLVAIYTSDSFALSSDCSSANMFNASPLLPAYDATKVDKSKACYYSKGGYFFSKANTKPWVDVYTQEVEEGQTIRNNMTITFHYDDAWDVYQDSLGRGHATYEMPTENLVTPGWVTYIQELNDVYTATAKFNPSFSLYRPTTCYKWFYNVHYLGGGFKGLEYLNTSDVTNMDYMFYDTNFPSIDLSHFNTENVTSMTYMFYGQHLCYTLDLSSFNTSKVTDMTGMFSGCTSLDSLDLSSFNTSEVISMAHMFERVCLLNSLDLTSFNIGKVTDMSYMFNHEASGNYRGCNLKNIYVNEDFVLGQNCLADNMFTDATTLPHYDGTADKTKAHYKEGGYLTLRRQFSVGDTKYNADGWGDETTCYDDVDFTADPEYRSAFDFSFSSDNTASYTRTTSNHWATLCLPFAFSADDNSTARFYSVKSYTDGNIAVTALTGTIAAGTPVLAYITNGELSVNATGAAAVAEAKQLSELKGVFAQTAVADDDYIIANDHFWNAAWLKENNSAAKHVYVAPYRAYLTLDLSTGAKPNSISISEGETDGIDSIDGTDLAAFLEGAELYDLQGRRLTAPKSGVMIVRKGGVSRKVVIK